MLPLVAREIAGWTQVWAPAKVNLYLRVVGKRPDGYHELATFMMPVPIFDTLSAREISSGIQFECDDPHLPRDSSNLVVKAAQKLAQKCGVAKGVQILLTKRIPSQAGMGGGSSDAAATLVCLNQLWNLGLGEKDLASLALDLGSDVPFFLGQGPAWCTGRGENLRPVAPAWGKTHLVVIKPAEGLSTREIFARYKPKNDPGAEETRAQMFLDSLKKDPKTLGGALFNDLEHPSMELLPSLASLRGDLLASGALGVVMTGSGSAMVALAADAGQAVSVAQRAGSARTPAGPVAVWIASPA